MKLSVRSRTTDAPSGLRGQARVDRRAADLAGRSRPGDIAVIDEFDLDRSTARALVDSGVVAVVNAAPMLSGRYPALGPRILAEAGVTLVDEIGADGFRQLRDGAELRLDDGLVHGGDTVLATGRPLGPDDIDEQMEAARTGLAVQLESFTHNSTEFLRREQDMLLHGAGVPRLRSRVARRPVVVVVDSFEHEEELRRIRRYVREQSPLLVAVDGGAQALARAGLHPDVIVLDEGLPDDDLPPVKVLRRATDVVVRSAPGGADGSERLERLGLRPLRFESAAAAEDAALVLADAGSASVIVGVGLHATLEEFLDRRRPGPASTYLTRLKVGSRLVDARVLPSLYSGRVRPWHLFVVLLCGLLALAAAVAVTPLGQHLVDLATPTVADWVDRAVALLPDRLRGVP